LKHGAPTAEKPEMHIEIRHIHGTTGLGRNATGQYLQIIETHGSVPTKRMFDFADVPGYEAASRKVYVAIDKAIKTLNNGRTGAQPPTAGQGAFKSTSG